MKKIIGISILLVGLILGGYFSTGLITERTLKQNLKALNQANGLAVDLVDYHRGLFRSTAHLTWQLQKPEKIVKQPDGHSLVIPPKAYVFDMPITIYHGPVMLGHSQVRFGLGAARGELVLPEAYLADFSDIFSNQSTKPTLSINLFVTYLNKTHIEIGLPAFELITKNNQNRFQWLGMETDLRFSPESTHVQGHFTLNGLRLVGNKYQVILKKVNSVYDVHKATNGLFLGKASLDLPELQVRLHQQPEFGLKKLSVHSLSEMHENLFDSSFSLGFDALSSREENYGPGKLDVAIKRLDANVLATVNQHISQLQQTDSIGGQAQQILLSLLPDLPKLLSKGAIFEISTLHVGLPHGNLHGAMRIAFPQLDTDAPMQMLSKIEGDAKLKLPMDFLKTLMVHSLRQQLMNAHYKTSAAVETVTLADLDQQAVQQTDQRLKHLIELGILQTKEADYAIELKLAAGRLLVNGRPFHSGMLSF